MSGIVWQDPPAAARVWRRWNDEAAELRANPNQWALLATMKNVPGARNFATQARQGIRAAFRPVGAWEFRTAKCEVYARYIGEDTRTEPTTPGGPE